MRVRIKVGIPPEISATLVPIILSLMGAAGIAGVAWLRKLTAQWEVERRELLEVMQETRAATQENKEILKENTTLARKLEQSSNGIQRRLQDVALKSTKVAGKYKGMIDAHLDEIPEKDELDALENELMEIIEVKQEK